MSDLDAPTRDRVNAALDSAARRPVRDIYREFDLVGRGITEAHFYKYAQARREEHCPEPLPDDGIRCAHCNHIIPVHTNDVTSTYERLMAQLNRAIDGDNFKALPGISMTVRALQGHYKLSIDQAAERRAQVAFEAKMAAIEAQRAKANESVDRLAAAGEFSDDLAKTIKGLYGFETEAA